MALQELIMREKTNDGIVLINPKNINEQLSHVVSRRTRKIGTTKQNVIRNEFAIVRMIDVAQCGSDCSLTANENCRLILSGTDPEKVMEILEDIYRNAKNLLTAHPASLQGVPLPFNVTDVTLTVADPAS